MRISDWSSDVCSSDLRFIGILEKSPVKVFGITDYFSADTYFELIRRYGRKYPDHDRAFFLNVEFRLSESISRDRSHPNIHVIFDNDPAVCGEDKIDRKSTRLNSSH